jgi:hypothetical protein
MPCDAVADGAQHRMPGHSHEYPLQNLTTAQSRRPDSVSDIQVLIPFIGFTHKDDV